MTKLTLKTAISPEALEKLSQLTKTTSSKTQNNALKKINPKAPQPEAQKVSRTKEKIASSEKLDRENARKNFRAASKWLEESFPKTFNFKEPKPLKIGIRHEFLNVESPFSRRQIHRALSGYIYRRQYLNAIIYGQWRYDLNGDQVEEISAEQKEYAKAQLALRKKADKNPIPEEAGIVSEH